MNEIITKVLDRILHTKQRANDIPEYISKSTLIQSKEQAIMTNELTISLIVNFSPAPVLTLELKCGGL